MLNSTIRSSSEKFNSFLENTYEAVRKELGPKEMRIICGKIPYILKALDFENVAQIPHFLKKYFIYNDNNNFILTKKIFYSIKNNKGAQEVVRQILALTTIVEEGAFILQATGLISAQTAGLAFLASSIANFARRSLACYQAKSFFGKACKNPESKKWSLWMYSSAMGALKAVSLACKVTSVFNTKFLYGYRQLLSVGTGLMALAKRKLFGKQKAQRQAELAKKEVKEVKQEGFLSKSVGFLLKVTALSALSAQVYKKLF